MKKTISFKTSPDQFQLLCEGTEILSIPKNNLTIDGKKLFDNFVSKLDLSSKIEFDYVDDPAIVDSNEKRIITDIKSVLNNIVQKINDKFKLLTDDIDEFLEDDSKKSKDESDGNLL
jgi:hypothetical protein